MRFYNCSPLLHIHFSVQKCVNICVPGAAALACHLFHSEQTEEEDTNFNTGWILYELSGAVHIRTHGECTFQLPVLKLK